MNNNESTPQLAGTSHNSGGINMACNGQRAGSGAISTASPRGGWKPFRASWLGMAAVILLAAALLAIGSALAGQASESEAATAVSDSTTGPIATSSTSANPRTIASSWSMPPLPEDGASASSVIDVTPVRVNSSVVASIR